MHPPAEPKIKCSFSSSPILLCLYVLLSFYSRNCRKHSNSPFRHQLPPLVSPNNPRSPAPLLSALLYQPPPRRTVGIVLFFQLQVHGMTTVSRFLAAVLLT